MVLRFRSLAGWHFETGMRTKAGTKESMFGSPESRAAARAMLNAKETEGVTIEVHIGVIGFGPDPNCSCRACRQKWSKATAEERTAARLRLESYLDRACGGSGRSPQPVMPAVSSAAPMVETPTVAVVDDALVVDDPRPDRALCQDDKEYTDKMAQWFIRQSAGKQATPTIVAVPPEQK